MRFSFTAVLLSLPVTLHLQVTEATAPEVPVADLAVVKTVNNPTPYEGEIVRYTVELSNNGPDTATNVEVLDMLPAGLTPVSQTATQGTFAGDIWRVEMIPAGTSDTLIIAAGVDPGTAGMAITNTAVVITSDQVDSDPTNDSDWADITVMITVDARDSGIVPKVCALHPGQPNPFREVTTIPFDTPRQGLVVLSIWNVRGRRVRNLVRSEVVPGSYRPIWDGRDDAGGVVPAGVYFVRLKAGDEVQTGKVVRLRG